jgi:hypothetical protein
MSEVGLLSAMLVLFSSENCYMTLVYRLGLSGTILKDLSSDRKFDVLQGFCTIHQIPELCEVIDSQVYMFYYGSNGTITWTPLDDYFGGDLSSSTLENYQNWWNSMPYRFFPDLDANIFIPLWDDYENDKPKYVTPIALPNTSLDSLNACSLDYLRAEVREKIKLVDELYNLYDCHKEDYLEIFSELERMCRMAEDYRMCLYAE